MIRINKILTGSALHRLRELDDEYIDCCITSPLYWSIVAKAKTNPQVWDPIDGNCWKGELGLEPTVQLYIEHLISIFDEVKRVLKPEGSCSVVMGDTYVNKCLSLIPEKFAIAMIDHGWILRSKIVWQKSNHIQHSSMKDRFEANWEQIYWFTKSKKYYFTKDLRRKTTGCVWLLPNEKRPKYFKFPNYPRTLARILVGAMSQNKGIVLDPFIGSGTTAVVAIEMGRRYLGIEVSKEFIKIATARIRNEFRRTRQRKSSPRY